MDHTNIHRYHSIHNEVMKRLQNEEITVEMAKQVNDLAYNKYVVENSELNEVINKTADKGKEIMQDILIISVRECFKQYHESIEKAIEDMKDQIDTTTKSNHFRDSLDRFKSVLEEAEKKDVYTFHYMDIDVISECYAKEAGEYKELLKNINKLKEIKRSDESIKNIPDKIEKIYNAYEDKMMHSLDSKEVYTLHKAKKVYEDLSKGSNNPSINIYIDKLKSFSRLTSEIGELVVDALKYIVDEDMADGSNGVSSNITHIKKAINNVNQIMVKRAKKYITAYLKTVDDIPKEISDKIKES